MLFNAGCNEPAFNAGYFFLNPEKKLAQSILSFSRKIYTLIPTNDVTELKDGRPG